MDWVEWMRLQDWRYKLVRYSANGGLADKRARFKLAREGFAGGDWDIFCPIPRRPFNGLAIELKTDTGKLTKSQKELKEIYNKAKIATFICRNFQQFHEVVSNYIDGSEIKK
jgi:hypothetical protein